MNSRIRGKPNGYNNDRVKRAVKDMHIEDYNVNHFYDMTQDIDHNLVVFLFFLHLACNQVDQLALLAYSLMVLYTRWRTTLVSKGLLI